MTKLFRNTSTRILLYFYLIIILLGVFFLISHYYYQRSHIEENTNARLKPIAKMAGHYPYT
jgi:disulfide bond formation protein DsbB